MRVPAGLLLALVSAIACSSVPPPPPSGATPTAISPPTPTPAASAAALSPTLGAWVDVTPSAVLLTEIGESRALTARAFDAAGTAASGAPTWTSSHPGVVAVGGDGTITASAFGSAQVTADVNGVKSAPVLVVVTTPAAEVVLVSDDQVAGAPVETDPTAEPSADNTYQVTLAGVTVKVGDRLLGTGEKALAGEVVAVDGQIATLKLIPLPELLPDLELREVIDLSRAPIVIPPGVALLYDVSRDGDTIDFTPKANFMELLPPAADARATPPPLARVGDLPSQLNTDTGELQYVTYSIPFFDQCRATAPTVPLQLAVPPAFSFTVTPSLDWLWTASEKHALLTATPTVKVAGGLKVNASFSGKVACEKTLFTYRIPAAGALSFFVSGLVPVKAEINLGGKLTVASVEAVSEVSATTTLTAGFSCAATTDCTVDGTMAEPTVTFVPRFRAPHLEFRFEPAAEAFGRVDLKIGNPFFQSFQLDLVSVKMGIKLLGDWAPKLIQMSDPAYRSNWKLLAEGGVTAGRRLPEVAAYLGLPVLTAAELVKISKVLAASPSGKLTTSQPSFTAGQPGRASVRLDEENLELLDVYAVDQMSLVLRDGEQEVVLDTITPTDGQTEFEFDFVAPRDLSSAELYPFVVTKLPPLDLFALELEQTAVGQRIAFGSNRDGNDEIYTMNSDGTDVVRLTNNSAQDYNPTWSPDGTQLAFSSGPPGNWAIWIMGADGSGRTKITDPATIDGGPAWSPDGTRIAFVRYLGEGEGNAIMLVDPDGSNLVTVVRSEPPNGFTLVEEPAWSPDGSRLAFWADWADETGANRDIFTIDAGAINGGLVNATRLTDGTSFNVSPAWSPDGSTIAYSKLVDTGNWELYAVGADGSGSAQLTNRAGFETTPAWSPDGSQLVFAAVLDGQWDIHVMNADGSDLRNVTNNAATDWFPAWGH